MSQKQNFIITTDQETADKLMLAGFQVMSHNGNVYTFLNQVPTNFSLETVDKKKVTYTNMLSL